MAEMIPDALPPRNMDGERITAGERRVFAMLRKLPDDCIVYYEPVVRRRHPDFIVIMPDAGLLVIEVKGWWHAELRSANSQSVVLNRRGQERSFVHPGRQARDYMRRVETACQEHRHAAALMQREGPHRNSLIFPRSFISVLTNINRGQLDKGAPELGAIFPPDRTATKDQLAEWEALEPEELAAALKRRFEPRWPFPPLTPRQIDVLRSAIHPEVLLRAGDSELAVLDLRQERNARRIGEGHRVLSGVAGSGKTVLLIARAKLLAEQSEGQKRILVLCYNRLLAAYLEASLKGVKGVTALPFHRWGGRNGAQFCQDDDAYGERVRARLQIGSRDAGRFDAVMVDECQDWPCSWFQAARLALKDPEAGDLLIVGDVSQALYRSRRFSWSDAGINARGSRTINTRFDLDRNYRNTFEILEAAQPFAVQPKRGAAAESAGLVALPVHPDKAMRNGPDPQIVELRDAEDEIRYAAALIETWLRGGVEIRGRREAVQPRDIAILYPRLRREEHMAALCGRLATFTRAVRLSPREKATGTIADDAVRIMTIKSARGLQFRIVLLIWTDLMPFTPHVSQRSELYVAMTRAEDMLVILHSGHSGYMAELHAARRERF